MAADVLAIDWDGIGAPVNRVTDEAANIGGGVSVGVGGFYNVPASNYGFIESPSLIPWSPDAGFVIEFATNAPLGLVEDVGVFVTAGGSFGVSAGLAPGGITGAVWYAGGQWYESVYTVPGGAAGKALRCEFGPETFNLYVDSVLISPDTVAPLGSEPPDGELYFAVDWPTQSTSYGVGGVRLYVGGPSEPPTFWTGFAKTQEVNSA